MEISKILSAVDHTLLAQNATKKEIKAVCDDALKYNTASVCIPPSFVKFAAEYLKGRIKVCTVIGFPLGYNKTEIKVAETKAAVLDGADEIDMVINIGWLKDKRYDELSDEINKIKEACDGRVLKVIIETCLLNEEEKVKMCDIVSRSGADYIKTSTGFSAAGATKEDIILFKENVRGIKIKAAGGIKSLEDAEEFLLLGADRLGTSRIVKILKEGENSGNSTY